MKDKPPLITDHTRTRWKERFGEASLKEAFDRAVPYGAQKGKSTLKIDQETGAVFVIKHGIVKTVLTKEMAVANQQLTIANTRKCNFNDHSTSDAIANEVKAIAEQHVRTNGVSIVGGAVRMNGAYKPRLKELRAIIPLDSKDYEKYLAIYYRTVTELGRKWLNSQKRP